MESKTADLINLLSNCISQLGILAADLDIELNSNTSNEIWFLDRNIEQKRNQLLSELLETEDWEQDESTDESNTNLYFFTPELLPFRSK